MENFGYLVTIGIAFVVILRWYRSMPWAVAQARESNEQFLLRNATADGMDPRRYEAAIARLTRRIERQPGDVLSYLVRATAHHARGRSAEAIADYSEVLLRQQSHTTALMNRANLYGSSGQYLAAVADLSRILEVHPRAAEALLLRAKAHFQAGRRDEAIGDLEQTRELGLSSRADRLERIHLWSQLRHDLEGCEAELERELVQDPQNVILRYIRGYLRSAAGRKAEARGDFEFVASRTDEGSEAAAYRGHAYMSLCRWSDAVAAYTSHLRNVSDDHGSRHRLANALVYLGEVDRALTELHKLVLHGGATADVHAERGSLLADSGRYHESIDGFRTALRIDPECVNALNGLAWLLSTCPSCRFRNGPEAVQLATRACEQLNWESESTLGTLGTAFAECGRFDEAVHYEMEAQARMSPAVLARWGFLLDRYRAGEPYRSSPGEYVREVRFALADATAADG